MSIRRIFLDWSRPALPVVVDWLVERYAGDGVLDLEAVVLALPASRAGRRLEELLLARADERGWRLRPPRIVTVGALPEMLYEPKRPFASPLAQQFAWADALRRSPADVLTRLVPVLPEDESLGGWLALGELLGRLHRELAADHHDFQTVVECGRKLSGFDEVPRWQALADIQQRYLDTLDRLGLWDRQTARRVAINEGECRSDRRLVLIGAVDLNLQQRLMLDQVAEQTVALVFAPGELADRFDDHGCLKPEAWEHAEIALRNDQITLADDPGDQAAAVARWMADLGGRFAADEITVGVSPDNQLVPHLQQQLDECGVPNRWGVGRPLARTSPCQLLAAVADYLSDGTFRSLAALVRHPAVGDWLRRQGIADDPATMLDRYFERRLPDRIELRQSPSASPPISPPIQSVGTDAPPGATGVSPGATGVSPGATGVSPVPSSAPAPLPKGERSDGLPLAVPLRSLLAPFSQRRPLGEWAEPILALLEGIFGDRPLDRDVEPDRGVVMACRKLRDRLREMAAVPGRLVEEVAASIDAATAIRLLLGQLEGDAVPPPPLPGAVELLGWLELPLDDAPALAVTGLHEGAMPQSVNADLFLPNRLRRALGVMDNDRRYARDAYALSLLAASRDELIVVVGRRGTDRNPLVPSRLLFACSAAELPRRAQRLFSDRDETPPPLPSPTGRGAGGEGRNRDLPATAVKKLEVPRPSPLIAPVQSMRVTEFRDYLACPFRYYLRHRLGLRPVDDRADELDAGAFGTLLHRVLKQFAEGPARESTDADEIAEQLDALLDESVGRAYGRHPLPAVRVQVEQLRARLHGFAQWQAAWSGEGWRIEQWEVQPADQTAKLVVDGEPMYLRGRIDRIDRHAGSGEWIVFDYKSGETVEPPDRAHRKAGEWVDLQLPLYRHLAVALGIDAPVRLGYIALPRSAEGVEHLLAEWSEAELREADEVAAAVVRSVRRERFWPPEQIPPSFSEDFAPICQDGQLGRVKSEE